MKELFLLMLALSMFIGLIFGRILIWRENKRCDIENEDSDVE